MEVLEYLVELTAKLSAPALCATFVYENAIKDFLGMKVVPINPVSESALEVSKPNDMPYMDDFLNSGEAIDFEIPEKEETTIGVRDFGSSSFLRETSDDGDVVLYSPEALKILRGRTRRTRKAPAKRDIELEIAE